MIAARAGLASTLLAVAAAAAACGPRPATVPEEPPVPTVEKLPQPSMDPFGHPYRWLSLGKLKYLEVVLGGADPDDTLPIAVIVHGLGDRPRIAREPEPEEMPLRVLMPEAPTPFDRGRAWFPIRVRDGRGADMAKALRQTTHELADFLDAAVARYGSPCRPIVAGFSQGGIVAWALAVRHPDSVTAAFPMASWLPPEIATEARQRAPSLPPVRMLHGDRDRIVPLRGTHSIVEVLAAGGASIELEVEEGAGHELTAGMKLRLARLFGESIARCVDAASM